MFLFEETHYHVLLLSIMTVYKRITNGIFGYKSHLLQVVCPKV